MAEADGGGRGERREGGEGGEGAEGHRGQGGRGGEQVTPGSGEGRGGRRMTFRATPTTGTEAGPAAAPGAGSSQVRGTEQKKQECGDPCIACVLCL